MDAGRRRIRAALIRPTDLLQQTRWLFWLTTLTALAINVPGLDLGGMQTHLPLVGAVAAVGLIATWTSRYIAGRAHIGLDIVEAATVTAAAALAEHPAVLFICVITAVLSRGLYGSARGLICFTLAMVGAILLAIRLWEALHGRALPSDEASGTLAYLLQIPPIAAVSRYLARSLTSREQSRLRDAALVQLGNRLVGVADHLTIRIQANDCLEKLCRATPGMQALSAHTTPDGLRVVADGGGMTAVPVIVPFSEVAVASDVEPATDGALPAGSDGRWLGVRTPDHPDRWVLLRAPRRVPADAVVAVQSLINIVLLALRSSEAHHDLTAQAHTDPLTGLANRAAFTTALDAALNQPQPRVALMFIDLDDFKIVNDGLGHAAGDELLRYVASRLRNAVRPGDLCARLGGDEFAVLLPDADGDAESTGLRLVELVSTPVSLRGQLAQVGASVGLAFATPDTSGEQLMQRADIAMYAAKAKGKNRVQVFDTSLLQDDGSAAFEAELAVAAGAGQLVVHYQPIMSVADGHCVAAEALVRWLHPTRGLLGPVEFIPTAERTGAIIDIGAYVLRSACAEAAGWPTDNGRLVLHVNVSAAQLTAPDFLGTVRDCLVEFDLAPKQLVLEVTESMVLDSPAIRVALDAIVALDVAIAIDDFGTGYSALTTLHTLPLDIVKIDKSFILGDASRAADEAVVGGIVQMAGRLGLQVIAEGVERLDQQAFLAAIGADAAQGYLHLRPTPAPAFAAWLRRQPRPTVSTDATVTTLTPRRTG